MTPTDQRPSSRRQASQLGRRRVDAAAAQPLGDDVGEATSRTLGVLAADVAAPGELGDVLTLGQDGDAVRHDLVDGDLGERRDASGVSPARIRAWMSRGRRTLSISISNWPSRARSPRRAARSLSSAGAANSCSASSTKTTRWPSALSPTSLSLRMISFPHGASARFPSSEACPMSVAGRGNHGQRAAGSAIPEPIPRASADAPRGGDSDHGQTLPAGAPGHHGGQQPTHDRYPVRRRGPVRVDELAGDRRPGRQTERDAGREPGHALGQPSGRHLGPRPGTSSPPWSG